MARHEKKTFCDQVVVLDGHEFEGCVFERCTLQYAGLRPVALLGNTVNACQWAFSGPAANAVQFMNALYRSSPQGAEMIEHTFTLIRGQTPKAPAGRMPAI